MMRLVLLFLILGACTESPVVSYDRDGDGVLDVYDYCPDNPASPGSFITLNIACQTASDCGQLQGEQYVLNNDEETPWDLLEDGWLLCRNMECVYQDTTLSCNERAGQSVQQSSDTDADLEVDQDIQTLDPDGGGLPTGPDLNDMGSPGGDMSIPPEELCGDGTVWDTDQRLCVPEIDCTVDGVGECVRANFGAPVQHFRCASGVWVLLDTCIDICSEDYGCEEG